jgi:hypothetical protein
MEGILVATAAPPQDIHFNSLCAFQDFRTIMNSKKITRISAQWADPGSTSPRTDG